MTVKFLYLARLQDPDWPDNAISCNTQISSLTKGKKKTVTTVKTYTF